MKRFHKKDMPCGANAVTTVAGSAMVLVLCRTYLYQYFIWKTSDLIVSIRIFVEDC